LLDKIGNFDKMINTGLKIRLVILQTNENNGRISKYLCKLLTEL